MQIAAFILIVGALVLVHELGHFVCAKLFGIDVLVFSLGFGPRIASFRHGSTEYIVGALPLGGYVQLRSHEEDSGERHSQPSDARATRREDANFARAFDAQPLARKAMVILAGPAMNFVLPFVLHFVIYVADSEVPGPQIGLVVKGHAADGILFPGDRVVSVDGDPVRTWYELADRISDADTQALSLDIIQNGEPKNVKIEPRVSRRELELSIARDVTQIGISPVLPRAVVAITDPNGPAGIAGLRTFDMVLSVGGKPTQTFAHVERALMRNRGALVPISYMRPIHVDDAGGGLFDVEVFDPRVATLIPRAGTDPTPERIGATSADLAVREVFEHTWEQNAGLREGDLIVSVNGKRVSRWPEFVAIALLRESTSPQSDLRIEVLRNGTRQALVAAGPSSEVTARNWLPAIVAARVANPKLIRYALARALERTAYVIELTTVSVVHLIQGRLAWRSIGGPITLYEALGNASRGGFAQYLLLMAFLSVNLGVVNLLPIPQLDGGQLVQAGIETAIQRPLPRKVRSTLAAVGLLLLATLTIVAFLNDLPRILTGP